MKLSKLIEQQQNVHFHQRHAHDHQVKKERALMSVTGKGIEVAARSVSNRSRRHTPITKTVKQTGVARDQQTQNINDDELNDHDLGMRHNESAYDSRLSDALESGAADYHEHLGPVHQLDPKHRNNKSNGSIDAIPMQDQEVIPSRTIILHSTIDDKINSLQLKDDLDVVEELVEP